MRTRLIACLAAIAIAVACGSSEESVFQPPPPLDDPVLPPGDDGGPGSFELTDAVARPDVTDAACASASAAAEKVPVDIVFMVDRSDSMKPAAKWPPCMAGLKLFFADPKSAGLRASIQYFCGNGNAAKCLTMTADWTIPDVPLTPLPETVLFTNSIDAQPFCNGTPTNAALQGAINYAKASLAPGRKTVVVLVTDGEPTDCGSVATVASTASSALPEIPVYVIGVGKSLKNLNLIAASGGTGAAILIDTVNPAATAKEFQDAVNFIRGSQLACEYVIPKPPGDKALDQNAVNVSVQAGTGPSTSLKYDKDCVGDGWRYDNPASPTKVILCGSTCDAVKEDPTAKVSILFGCATVGGVPH